MRVCKTCGYPDSHPLGLIICSDGICMGCKTHNEKYSIRWDIKRRELFGLAEQYRSRRQSYDCIVPVNGGTDSYFTVFYVKEVLGLNPLCVHYNSLYTNRVGHRNLANLRSRFNVDIHMHIPPLEHIRELNRATLYTLNSMYWHVHAGSTAFPVQLAVKYGISLIVWGGHEAVEQVGMYSHHDQVEMTARYREDHHLMGWDISRLETAVPSIRAYNNSIYRYPDYDEIKRAAIRGIYLSNYIPWNQKSQQEFMAKRYGYKQMRAINSFNGYEHPHCAFYNGVHDWLKYVKHGYGRYLDHLVREIRWKRVTKTDGFTSVRLHRPSCPRENIQLFREFMGLARNAFDQILSSARDPSMFRDGRSSVYRSIGVMVEDSVNQSDFNGLKDFGRIQSAKETHTPHILLNGLPI